MKTALKIVGIVVAVLIVIAIIVPLLVNVNSFKPQIESKMSEALGRRVTVGNLSLSILSGSVGADQLSIADDPKFSNSPFITAKTLKVGVELLPLIFSKQLNVTQIVIDQPQIALLRNREGTWNFSSLGNQNAEKKSAPADKSSSSAGNVSVGELEIRDGKMSLGFVPAKRKPVAYENVHITLRNFSSNTASPVTVSLTLPGGGSLKMDGTIGPMNSTDAALTPLKAELDVNRLDLAQSALVDPSAGIAGFADFDGSLDSDGRTAKTSGTLKATSLKLVPKGSPAGRPVELRYAVEHDLQKQAGRLSQGNVSMGKAVANLTGTYNTQGETTALQMRLVGENMPVDELEAMLPAVGVILPSGSQLKGGTMSVVMDSVGPADRLVSTGTVKLSNSQLAGFDLGSKMSAISALSGKPTGKDMTIQNLSSNVRNAPDGTRLDNISLIVPSLGSVSGAGTVSPAGTLDFKMSANPSGMAGGLTKVAGMGSGTIPFMVQGTASDPKFVPDVKGIVGSEVKGLMGAGAAGKNPLGGLGGLLGKKKPN